MFLTVKSKSIILAAIILLIISAPVFALKLPETSMPQTTFNVVVDAGHGGIDGGSVGRNTGKTESYLNLEYAKRLNRLLINYGFNAVMTRTDMNGLYSPLAANKKKDDMQKRKEIIEKSKADMVISIHMNSFPSSASKGAQVFYKAGDKGGEALANSIQNEFLKNLPNARKTPQSGDYFMVNCTDKPSVIVECGFLSNPAEEQLLINPDYMDKVTYSIFCGIIKFLGLSESN